MTEVKKPKKDPKVKYDHVKEFVPDGYVPPVEPEKPKDKDLDPKREAIRQAVRDIMVVATRPLGYDTIYHMLRDGNVDMKWLRHEVHYLISEVDEEINPEDFVAPPKEA